MLPAATVGVTNAHAALPADAHLQTVSRTAMELLLEDGGQAQATTQRQGSQAGTAAGAAALAALEEDPSSFKGLYAL